MLSLRELQSRFFYSIARPLRVQSEEWQGFDGQLLSVIRPHGQLGSHDRLDIYAQMYCARLLDALQEDYPCILALLGEEQFRVLGRAYLRQYPSTHPSLRYLGSHFPEFIATQTMNSTVPFLPDLARLERARVEVFDALDTEPLRSEDLHVIPAEAWATIRFRVIPALITLTCAWPVQQIWKEDSFTVGENIQPERTALRVWRQDFAVYQVRMDAIEQAALMALIAGEPFATVCTIIESLVATTDDVSATIGSLLLRWIEDGILSRAYDV